MRAIAAFESLSPASFRNPLAPESATPTTLPCAASRVTSATRRSRPEVLAAMTRSLAHRGPDADGFFVVGPRASRPPPAVGDRHRRQSAADDRPPTAASPSCSTARSTISARCATNSRAAATTFRTAGDTEVLLAGWRAWGERVVDAPARHVRVRAVGRARRSTLFAARDHLGVKPLHYAWDGAHARVRLAS